MNQKRGFTLIELSIVLVIIGLIIGGILVGSTLIRQAEYKTVIRDLERYTTAINTFKLKYNAMPGDMPNATNIWGTRSNCNDATPGITTCNGNGNGNIEGIWFNNESTMLWHHLTNAQLVDANITSTYVNVTCDYLPPSKLDSACYFAQSVSVTDSFPDYNNNVVTAGYGLWVVTLVRHGLNQGLYRWRYEDAVMMDMKFDNNNLDNGNITMSDGDMRRDCNNAGRPLDCPVALYFTMMRK